MRVARAEQEGSGWAEWLGPWPSAEGRLVEKATSVGVPTWIPEHSGTLKEHLFPIVLSH